MKPATFLGASIALAALFMAFPGLDEAFSHLFYVDGEKFFLKGWGPFVFLYDIVPLVLRVTVGLIIIMALIRLIPDSLSTRAPAILHARGQAIVFIVLSLAIGPGLVTNEVLKNHVDRARPAQTTEFGGTKTFTPAFIVSDQCERNCAFVSGHASMGFFFASFGFLMIPGFRRTMVFSLAIAFGAAVGLARIAQGAHYLSDVIFAGVINIAIAWALYHWIVTRNGLGRETLSRVWHRITGHKS